MIYQMNEFNTYLNDLDYSLIKDLCERKGKVRTYRKGDFFIRQHEKKRFAGWVEDINGLLCLLNYNI